MPILMLLDVSLSMLAPAGTAGENLNSSRRTISILGASAFLDHLDQNNRQESVSMAAFSEDVDVTDFTRDYKSLKELLTKSGAYDVRSKTNMVDALRGALYRCISIWGSSVTCHVVVVTDCAGCDLDFESLINSTAKFRGKEPVEPPSAWPQTQSHSDRGSLAQEFDRLIRRGLFTFHVVCVNGASSNEPVFRYNARLFKKLVEFFDRGGSFRFIDEPAIKNCASSFRQLADELSAPSSTILQCGSLSAQVDVHPALSSIRQENDFDIATSKLGEFITILGFLRPIELGSPPITSRHILIPAKKHPNAENMEPSKQKPYDEDKSPNFCVLLHGAMKTEDMAAICEIGPSWYGYVYHVPAGTRSSLVLYCFEPGVNAVPWLGPLNKLSLRPFAGPPGAGGSTKSPFPIAFKTKPSYAMSSPNWVHNYGLQSDIQKLLRYAKKLPDKEQQFYQELNRICNSALALGFTELFISLARVFEKEVLNFGVNSSAGHILSKVINALVSDRMKYGEPILPFVK